MHSAQIGIGSALDSSEFFMWHGEAESVHHWAWCHSCPLSSYPFSRQGALHQSISNLDTDSPVQGSIRVSAFMHPILSILCLLQRGLRNGLEAVAAIAEGLCTDPDLAAAPSDMPSTSDSGSHTHDITGAPAFPLACVLLHSCTVLDSCIPLNVLGLSMLHMCKTCVASEASSSLMVGIYLTAAGMALHAHSHAT